MEIVGYKDNKSLGCTIEVGSMMEHAAVVRNAKVFQRVIFIVQYVRVFTNEEFNKIDEQSGRWKEELPKRSVAKTVRIHPGASQAVLEDEKAAGMTFEAVKKDGNIEYGLKFEENRIQFFDGKNALWTQIVPRAEVFLEQANALVSQENQVDSYALDYHNTFQVGGKYEPFDARNFFRIKSKFVPKHIWSNQENFHFHTGFFKTINQYRVLTRINVDLRDNDENRTRDLAIAIFHSILSLREPWGKKLPLPENILNRGKSNFAKLGDLNDKVLKKLFNDEAVRRIGILQ